MSEKVRDKHGRWRSKTIAFRISPEENKLLEEFVKLSGLSKQTYIINRVLARDVTIIPNPRVHKALKSKMEQLCEQFAKFKNANDISPETMTELQFVGKIYEGLSSEK